MMTLEKARKIWWNYDIDDETLNEWVETVNNRPPDPPGLLVGETVEIASGGVRTHAVITPPDLKSDSLDQLGH